MRDDIGVRDPVQRPMGTTDRVRNELAFRGPIEVLSRSWKLIAMVGVVALALSAIFSGPTFIAPRYRSTATVYPVNLNSYSIETRTDQLLQLLESNSIRDTLIHRFALLEVYDVDTGTAGGHYALYNEYADRVDITKTRYESVQIEVVDEDPRRARDMVSVMLEQVNLLARRLQREKSEEILRISERALAHERQKLDSVERRLDRIRNEAGILSYESQVRELTKGYVRMVQEGVPAARMNEVQSRITALEQKGGEFRQLTELSNMFRNNYDRLLTEYERVMSDVTKELTYTNTIIYPEISDKKVYPIRWLIVSTATLSAMFLCFLLVYWRDRAV